MSKALLLFPAGGNAREALAVIEAVNRLKKTWNVLGFIDDDASLWGKKINNVKILGDKALLKKFPRACILAVPGNPKSYLKRKDIIDSLGLNKSRFATIVHPTAVIASDAKVGYNTLIMAHVAISCGVSIGNHCIILPNTTVSHESRVGDYSCIGANVSIAGSVVIKHQCYIGSGVNIRENLSVGSRSLAGLGANVTKDVAEDMVVIGNPARPLRKVTQ